MLVGLLEADVAANLAGGETAVGTQRPLAGEVERITADLVGQILVAAIDKDMIHKILR